MSKMLLINQKSTISGHCKKLAGYLWFFGIEM
jgi:hypothetical protein